MRKGQEVEDEKEEEVEVEEDKNGIRPTNHMN